MTPEFLLTTLIVVATPGAGVLYTLAAGVSRGWQASLVAAFACTLGIVPHMIAAVTGLAAIMHASAVAFSIIKYLSAVFMGVTLAVFSVYGVFAAAVRTKVFSRPRIVAWVRRSFGATYLMLAGRLAAQTR